ncbi:hypothetical protein HETIRDRAFT_50006 [Heterobasidion irregulare TC 32-1]|uniref:FAD/NAD(P)-binding domain-containing protein n=1 Tax=Heterobasidion irregulare (strain TC 32-1) TaxID=747525 RepID=W4K0V4_HETIT|nr:uncharacterized protein HETIRDRAFT_50006 [Heterobasidion irregulare TC 32-1]ETW79334.1 hypothetical protein HETIRDRAFT_50006 [Heterobasidion irregulare TC 32-1]
MTASLELPPRPTGLPTLESLNATVPSDVSPESVSQSWLEKLSATLSAQTFDDLDELFISSATWKDILALTWDFRSVRTLPSIRTMLAARAGLQKFSVQAITAEEGAEARGAFKSLLVRPFPDTAWVQFGFAVVTGIGQGTGTARLVPTGDGTWKAWTVFTSIDQLRDFPEKVGAARLVGPVVDWVDRRARELDFVDSQPTVLIIGGGHVGLELAARLKYSDISALVVEKAPRIGDSWRHRYDCLCLHDPVWFNHMPYLPFPSTWPRYPPSKKIASWLEAYAENLDLNVWTSTNTQTIKWNEGTKDWTVTVTRSDGRQRILSPKYVIFAHGSGGGVANMPDIPQKEAFRGQVYHSSEFRSGKYFKGKKAIVVGACNSGHDIAHDLYDYGADVTMFQRSTTYVISAKALAMQLKASHYVENGPPTEVADRLGASIPHFIVRLLQGRAAQRIADTVDKELHDNLRKVGFGLSLGVDGGGIISLLTTRRGGFYMNVGTSQLIADGRIKLKHGSAISRFSSNGLYFEDGTHLDAEVVIFATGYGDARDLAHELCEPEVVDKVGEVWGIDKEGELNGVWRDSGHPHLFFAQGNFVLARQYSAYLALQIKASEEGLISARYTIHKQYGQGT